MGEGIIGFRMENYCVKIDRKTLRSGSIFRKEDKFMDCVEVMIDSRQDSTGRTPRPFPNGKLPVRATRAVSWEGATDAH